MPSHTLQTVRKQLLNWSHGTVGSSLSRLCLFSLLSLFPVFMLCTCSSPMCILKKKKSQAAYLQELYLNYSASGPQINGREDKKKQQLRINMEILVASVAMFLRGKLAVRWTLSIFFLILYSQLESWDSADPEERQDRQFRWDSVQGL